MLFTEGFGKHPRVDTKIAKEEIFGLLEGMRLLEISQNVFCPFAVINHLAYRM